MFLIVKPAFLTMNYVMAKVRNRRMWVKKYWKVCCATIVLKWGLGELWIFENHQTLQLPTFAGDCITISRRMCTFAHFPLTP